MRRFSKITQTEDPTPFPLESNLDSSIQQSMYKDENINSSKDCGMDATLKQPNLISIGEELELKDQKKNFATMFVISKNAWYLVDKKTNEIIKEIITERELHLSRVRNNMNMLKNTFASLNIYEKEIIVWIRMHINYYRNKFDIVVDIMHKFNISEGRSAYLIDSSGF